MFQIVYANDETCDINVIIISKVDNEEEAERIFTTYFGGRILSVTELDSESCKF